MKNLSKQMQSQFEEMQKSGKLFRVKLTGSEVWKLYLKSFSKEDDPVFRDPNSTTHNCNNCHNFIRRYGNIVSIKDDFNLSTIFDISKPDNEFKNTCKVLSKAITNSFVEEVFFETFNELSLLPYEKCKKGNEKFQLGVHANHKVYTEDEAAKYGVVKKGEIKEFNHMHLFLNKTFVDFSGSSVESIMGKYRDDKNVFMRAMEEISLDTLELVRDLTNQGSLLDAQTHLHKVEAMIILKKEYDQVDNKKKNNWCWVKSYNFQFAKFRNELIGVLCKELSEGMNLNEACLNWNKRVDPANYMKVTAPITQKQIKEAEKFVEENGYTQSFERRFANIGDISVSDILHVNESGEKVKKGSLFKDVKATSTRHKRAEFDGVEEIGIDKFMTTILPTCTSVEAFLLNNHEGNMVSLTTASNPDSKRIFKWGNNYSWTYNGNLAGKSQIKEAVKSRGGKTEAVVRVSIHFPDTEDDYDLHCVEPNKNHIYYGNRRELHKSSGMLDLDAQGADGRFPPEKRVENLTYSDKSQMFKGDYILSVNNYSRKNLHTSFNIEVEIEGDITSLTFIPDKKANKKSFGKLHFDGRDITFTPENCNIVDSKTVSKEIYGLETNQFHKVNLVCLSPNHWVDEVGNKHYFFMLEGCKSPVSIRSFHNENLIGDLQNHRKVLEVLGNTCMIPPSDKQLSGLGFNATVKDEVILRLQGSHKRVVKVKFG